MDSGLDRGLGTLGPTVSGFRVWGFKVGGCGVTLNPKP